MTAYGLSARDPKGLLDAHPVAVLQVDVQQVRRMVSICGDSDRDLPCALWDGKSRHHGDGLKLADREGKHQNKLENDH